MESKNRDLALKNIHLKEELNKLVQKQNDLLKQNIKGEHMSFKLHARVIEVLDESIFLIEEAVSKLKNLKFEIKKKRNTPLNDKTNKT